LGSFLPLARADLTGVRKRKSNPVADARTTHTDLLKTSTLPACRGRCCVERRHRQHPRKLPLPTSVCFRHEVHLIYSPHRSTRSRYRCHRALHGTKLTPESYIVDVTGGINIESQSCYQITYTRQAERAHVSTGSITDSIVACHD
jgi:hypothetical protein